MLKHTARLRVKEDGLKKTVSVSSDSHENLLKKIHKKYRNKAVVINLKATNIPDEEGDS